MRIKLSLLMLLCMALPSLAATGLTGTLVDARTGKAVADANILLRDQAIFVTSGTDGTFTISNAAPGTDVLQIIAYGYSDAYKDVTIVKDIVKNIGEIRLDPSGFDGSALDSDNFLFDEEEILDEEGSGQNVGTILGATDDIYYQTSNYDFSTLRFRWRGYDSNWNTGYINGINFNDAMRGRFNFSGLGGMTSSAFRNRSTDIGLDAAPFGYGNIGGSSNFTTYASEYAPGFKGSPGLYQLKLYAQSDVPVFHRSQLQGMGVFYQHHRQICPGRHNRGYVLQLTRSAVQSPEGIQRASFTQPHRMGCPHAACDQQRRDPGGLRPRRHESLQPGVGLS